MSVSTEAIRQQFALTEECAPVPLMAPPSVATPAQSIRVEEIVAMVTEEVTVRAIVPTENLAKTTHLADADRDWTWQDLRDYVVGQIEQRFEPFPRDDKKETGIFKSFLSRYPDMAARIARYAFEARGGYWKGAPVSVTRFCKGSDPYFADIIVANLRSIDAQ